MHRCPSPPAASCGGLSDSLDSDAKRPTAKRRLYTCRYQNIRVLFQLPWALCGREGGGREGREERGGAEGGRVGWGSGEHGGGGWDKEGGREGEGNGGWGKGGAREGARGGGMGRGGGRKGGLEEGGEWSEKQQMLFPHLWEPCPTLPFVNTTTCQSSHFSCSCTRFMQDSVVTLSRLGYPLPSPTHTRSAYRARADASRRPPAAPRPPRRAPPALLARPGRPQLLAGAPVAMADPNRRDGSERSAQPPEAAPAAAQ